MWRDSTPEKKVKKKEKRDLIKRRKKQRVVSRKKKEMNERNDDKNTEKQAAMRSHTQLHSILTVQLACANKICLIHHKSFLNSDCLLSCEV